MDNAASATPRRRLLLTVLLGVGSLAVIAGVIWGAVAKAAVDQIVVGPSAIPTLPVHVYAQYTQRFVAPDYSGLWAGGALAVLGLALLLAGLVVLLRGGATRSQPV